MDVSRVGAMTPRILAGVDGTIENVTMVLAPVLDAESGGHPHSNSRPRIAYRFPVSLVGL